MEPGNHPEVSLAKPDGNSPEYTHDDQSFGDGLWPEYCNPSYRMPAQIEVKVSMTNGDYYFPLSIVKAQSSKPYLGGYKHKLNGHVYHHASSQTPPDNKKTVKDTTNLRSRETQTAEYITRSVQCFRESGTQMERIDLCLDNKRDIEIVPKKYFSSRELLLLQKTKTIEIQRCWRGYMARCLAVRTRRRNIEIEQQALAEKEALMLEEKTLRQAEMNRRNDPKDNNDFAIMYNELADWRIAEIAKIKATTTPGPARIEAMNALLSNETKALQSIQRLKGNAVKDMHTNKTKEMLSLMARPQQWQLSNGTVCAVQTPASQRAKELLELYTALGGPVQSVEERLDVLIHVKWTVKEFSSQLTSDIIDLVDREADLLNRGRPPKTMTSLRDRLGNLFLQFLENSEYNPRASEFLSTGVKNLT